MEWGGGVYWGCNLYSVGTHIQTQLLLQPFTIFICPAVGGALNVE